MESTDGRHHEYSSNFQMPEQNLDWNKNNVKMLNLKKKFLINSFPHIFWLRHTGSQGVKTRKRKRKLFYENERIRELKILPN